jgi:hypothetical protein
MVLSAVILEKKAHRLLNCSCLLCTHLMQCLGVYSYTAFVHSPYTMFGRGTACSSHYEDATGRAARTCMHNRANVYQIVPLAWQTHKSNEKTWRIYLSTPWTYVRFVAWTLGGCMLQVCYLFSVLAHLQSCIWKVKSEHGLCRVGNAHL